MKKKEKNLIRVCDNCGKPIIWTFAFPGAEWYCPSCGAQSDMFYGEDVKATPKLIKLRKSLAIRFGQIRHYLYMGGERKEGCKKCDKFVSKNLMRVDSLLQDAYMLVAQTRYTEAHAVALLLQDVCNDLTDCGCK